MKVMKTKKTSYQNRGTYIYTFDTGDKHILKPGENGVTAEMIKILHSEDDHEVYYNLKNISISVDNQNYDANNPLENQKKKRSWHCYFNYSHTNPKGLQIDKNRIMYEASYTNPFDSTDKLTTRMTLEEELKGKFTDSQKTILLLICDGYKSTEIAKMLGVSDAAITKTKKRIAKILLPYKMYLKELKKS